MNANAKRVAIIGYGQQGRECYELIKNRFSISVLVDPKFKELDLTNKEVRDREGLENFSGSVFCSAEEAIQTSNFDVAIVCVPHNAHFDITKKLLFANKPVIKEKPFALKSVEVIELTRLSEEKTALYLLYAREMKTLYLKKPEKILSR